MFCKVACHIAKRFINVIGREKTVQAKDEKQELSRIIFQVMLFIISFGNVISLKKHHRGCQRSSLRDFNENQKYQNHFTYYSQ
jgi:hypothetical protein